LARSNRSADFAGFPYEGGAYALGKILGAVFYAVENADVLQAATVVKEVVPGERGVDRDGRARTLPGEVGTLGHGKVRLVVSGHGLLAGEHDAGLGGFFAYVGGNPLIDAGAGVNDQAGKNSGAGGKVVLRG
jgi:hypothetical protein